MASAEILDGRELLVVGRKLYQSGRLVATAANQELAGELAARWNAHTRLARLKEEVGAIVQARFALSPSGAVLKLDAAYQRATREAS